MKAGIFKRFVLPSRPLSKATKLIILPRTSLFILQRYENMRTERRGRKKEKQEKRKEKGRKRG
ncbi:hypothetical protein E2C01_055852 [Portunus trituberculatus]|uniref:Uncharacterized protein n=1 Tax=Portunus trituberculatus TaxID=210409 RepID=A0A5B7GVV0_PORTR|nr:hypothetical protein [Portunus trituberculatus]